MNICDFGCNQTAIKQFSRSKKWCCCDTPNKCPGKRLNDSLSKKGKDPFYGKTRPNLKGRKPWHVGKTFDEIYGPEKAAYYRDICAKTIKNTTENLSIESRKIMSDKARANIQKRYESGWMPKAGRCKKIHYNSPIAGDILIDGTWELYIAKYLDSINVKWIRNTKKFSYINFKNKESKYTPDFYIYDSDLYIEVKGYETDLDRCKWQQFTEKLFVIKKELFFNIKKIVDCQNSHFQSLPQ